MPQQPGDDPPDSEGVRSLRVRFAAGEVTLAGTLMVPEGLARPAPAMLILSGSGPQDRNGNAPGSELRWNYLHSFASVLTKRGIITLRTDDRGVAHSGGSFAEAGFQDFLDDARSALTYLESRDDVDHDRVGVLGHSEGALLAAQLAGESRSIAALVLIGAPAEPLDRILISQVRARALSRGGGEREAARLVADLRAFFEHVRLSNCDVLEWKGQVRNVRWLRQHLLLSPARLYEEVRCPTLVLHGRKDLQVPVDHAERVLRSLGAMQREKLIFEGLDHFLMPTAGSLSAYGDAHRRVSRDALLRLAEEVAVRLGEGN